MSLSIARAAAAASCLFASAYASHGILSPTAPMGFNNWARYMGGLNQTLFVQTAEAMTDKGLLDAGYNRINLDDEWSTMSRLANGSMDWDDEKFPKGLPWLTHYLKSMGFTPGIYTDAGTMSCGGYPGAYGYEEIDAETFARWGFEYVKLDGCNMPEATEAAYKAVYGKWHSILSKMERPMVFSESAPAYFTTLDNLTDWYTVMGWVPKYGQLARHSTDILVFNSTAYWPDETGWEGIMNNYGYEVLLARYQRPGYYNDPDFLNVDHPGYTLDEKKSHFALWASFSAPLILSTDVLNMTHAEVEYLTNKDIIEIDQDPLVQQATLVSQAKDWDVLTKSLQNGDRLLTVLNKGSKSGSLTVPWEHIGLTKESMLLTPVVEVKDLWTGKSSHVKPLTSKGITATHVPSHGTAIFRLSNALPHMSMSIVPTGQIFNTQSLHCLTVSGCDQLSWVNCTGENGQIWRTPSEGTLSSLQDEKKCLVEESGRVRLAECVSTHKSSKSQWKYFESGNLINTASKHCLTEGDDSTVTSEKCGYEANEQVIALPVGVPIEYL